MVEMYYTYLNKILKKYGGLSMKIVEMKTSNYEDVFKLIGSILCGHDGRRGYIYHTAVDIKYRGRGIGKKLVNSVINALKQEGINKATLVVFTNNEIGSGFWRSIGWEKREDLNYYNLSLNNEN